MSTPVDLQQLALRREKTTPTTPTLRRHLLARYFLPGGILVGFLVLIGWSLRESFLPAHPVTVEPVVTTRSLVQNEGTPLFQAAGWVEPKPTPILVTALAEGVVEELLVVEDQAVKAGEPVAELVKADARLELEAARADLRQKEAEAEAILAKTDTDLFFIPFQLQAAEAKHKLAGIELKTRLQSRVSLPEISISRAEGELATARASLEDLKARKKRLEREVKSLRHMLGAYRLGEVITPGHKLPLTDVEAAMLAGLTKVKQAQVAVATAQLQFDRMTIHAPVSGRIFALVARPGFRLMTRGGQASIPHPGQGLSPSMYHDPSTIVSMYEPDKLQVRADVRFEDLAGVVPDQTVRIETPVLAEPVEGKVLFLTSIANIQKNTLEVKVNIPNPPAVLKPDMLVTVTFLAPAVKEDQRKPTEQLRILVPKKLVITGESGTGIWVADQANGVARFNVIRLGRDAGELVEVLEGLNPADKVITGGREGLQPGQRIRLAGGNSSSR